MRLEVKVGCSLMLYPQGPAGFRLKARSQSEDFRIRKACLVRIQKCRLYRAYQEIGKTVDTWDLWDSLWTGADAHNSSTGLKFLMNNWSWLLPWVKQQLMPGCKSPDLFKQQSDWVLSSIFPSWSPKDLTCESGFQDYTVSPLPPGS